MQEWRASRVPAWCRVLTLANEDSRFSDWTHPKGSLFKVLSRLTQLTSLTLELRLDSEKGKGCPLRLPLLQRLELFIEEDCQPALDYASLHSTTLTNLSLHTDTYPWIDGDKCKVSSFRPQPVVPLPSLCSRC